eukprot:6196396-Pyramimonas_sp.AAC.1
MGTLSGQAVVSADPRLPRVRRRARGLPVTSDAFPPPLGSNIPSEGGWAMGVGTSSSTHLRGWVGH